MKLLNRLGNSISNWFTRSWDKPWFLLFPLYALFIGAKYWDAAHKAWLTLSGLATTPLAPLFITLVFAWYIGVVVKSDGARRKKDQEKYQQFMIDLEARMNAIKANATVSAQTMYELFGTYLTLQDETSRQDKMLIEEAQSFLTVCNTATSNLMSPLDGDRIFRPWRMNYAEGLGPIENLSNEEAPKEALVPEACRAAYRQFYWRRTEVRRRLEVRNEADHSAFKSVRRRMTAFRTIPGFTADMVQQAELSGRLPF